MISKWFIGVSAKSKGFFTGWSYPISRYNRATGLNEIDMKTRPSFTKQTALAKSFPSKEKAEEEIALYLKESMDERTKKENELNELKSMIPLWGSYTDDQRWAYGEKFSFTIRLNGGGLMYFNSYYRDSKTDNILRSGVHWDYEIEKISSYVKLHQDRIDFIKNNLIAREQDLEIKFCDNERKQINWTMRDEDDTCNNYCNCCGGAVPSIPQLIIKGKRYREYTVICAICMKRLAQEAEIQAGKISDEILSHYETDRFLRSLD